MEFIYNDGGRHAAGFRGTAKDCVARSIAIASGLPYADVYKTLAEGNATGGKTATSTAKRGAKSARNGIKTDSVWFKNYMQSLGFEYINLYRKGVKMRTNQLPFGRLVLNLTRHYAAVIDGVLHDTYDCQRTSWVDAFGVPHEDVRTVFGYWIYRGNATPTLTTLLASH